MLDVQERLQPGTRQIRSRPLPVFLGVDAVALSPWDSADPVTLPVLFAWRGTRPRLAPRPPTAIRGHRSPGAKRHRRAVVFFTSFTLCHNPIYPNFHTASRPTRRTPWNRCDVSPADYSTSNSQGFRDTRRRTFLFLFLAEIRPVWKPFEPVWRFLFGSLLGRTNRRDETERTCRAKKKRRSCLCGVRNRNRALGSRLGRCLCSQKQSETGCSEIRRDERGDE